MPCRCRLKRREPADVKKIIRPQKGCPALSVLVRGHSRHSVMHTYIPTYLHTHPPYLPYIPTLRTYPTYLPYIPTLHTYLLAYMHACMHACMHEFRQTQPQTQTRPGLAGSATPATPLHVKHSKQLGKIKPGIQKFHGTHTMTHQVHIIGTPHSYHVHTMYLPSSYHVPTIQLPCTYHVQPPYNHNVKGTKRFLGQRFGGFATPADPTLSPGRRAS